MRTITHVFTTALLLAAASAGLAAQESDRLPIPVENKQNLAFDARKAARIYSVVSQAVAHELNPTRSAELRPAFRLVLDKRAKGDAVEIVDGKVVIVLRKWDEENFAQAVALCALQQAMDRERLAATARRALKSLNATVSVAELKEKTK